MGKFGQKISWAIAGVLVSASAQASNTGTITFEPVQVGIPTLGNSMLVILGVLMAVVALRVIGSGNGALNKIASVTILGSGLLLSGHGIENSRATIIGISAIGGDCSTGATLDYNPDIFQDFNNQCSVPLLITATSISCNDISDIKLRGCSENDVIEPGSSCALDACDNN